MDISGRIKAVLAAYPLEGREKRIYSLMVRAVLQLEPAPPLAVCDGDDDADDERRRIYEVFRETGSIRAFRRFKGGRWEHSSYLAKRFEFWRSHAERLVDRGLSPAWAVWYHWMLVLGEDQLGIAADKELLRRLWFRGFYEQAEAGHVHRLTPDTLLDGFVYDDLCIIHAAYNSAKVIRNAEMMEQVRRAVRWHVENTQPDNSTNEPWGLAAFAALDETGTFAEQQLHDAVTYLQNSPPPPDGRVPVAVGLLADAMMTMEN